MRERLRQLAGPRGRRLARRWRLRGGAGPNRRPPTRPSDWQIGPPDFVGVGAQRAGTTWWYRLLCDHPRVERSPKELHFFDPFFARELTDADVLGYHRLFPRPPGSLIGEWTPRYMHDFWTPALLRRAAPDARILMLLRDPLARYRSGVSKETQTLVDRGVRRGRREYVAAMNASDALSRSLYARQLANVLEQFDRAQVLVLQFERCVEDPVGQLQRTYRFLDLAPADHLPPGLTERRGRRPPQIEPTDAVTGAARRAVLRDVTELTELVADLDLSLWPSCRGLAGSGS